MNTNTRTWVIENGFLLLGNWILFQPFPISPPPPHWMQFICNPSKAYTIYFLYDHVLCNDTCSVAL